MINYFRRPTDILDYIEIPPIRRIIASITLISFLLTILWTNGLAEVAGNAGNAGNAENAENAQSGEKTGKKGTQESSVYYKWATVREQAQHGILTEITDSEKNQVYRFNKEGKLVELDDRNSGKTQRFEYDSQGNASIKTIKSKDVENREIENAPQLAQLLPQQIRQQIDVVQQVQTIPQKTALLAEAVNNFFSGEDTESNKSGEGEGTKSQANKPQSPASVSSWLKKYSDSDPQKQQGMLAEIGATETEVKNLSEETKQKIADYLALSGSKLPDGAVTTKELSDRKEGLAGLIDRARAAVTLLFVNIIRQVAGKKTQKENAGVEISVEDIQNIARQLGIELNATKTNIDELKGVLAKNPVIVHTQDSNGDRMFLIITDIKGEDVVGIDSDGKTRVLIPLSEFRAKWTGKMLSLAMTGEALDAETKKNTKGTFFAQLFNEIKRVFSGSLVAVDAGSQVATTEAIGERDTSVVAIIANVASLASPDVVAKSPKGVTEQPQETATIVSDDTTTTQTDAEKALQSIEAWLGEYIKADPLKKAQMAATLGLSTDQLANLSIETAGQILNYLKSQGDKIFNCAIQALKNIFTGQGVEFNLTDVATKAILIDIITGNLKIDSNTGYDASQLQLSMFAIQKTAELHNVQLTGYSTDINGLQQAIAGDSGVVVHLDLGNGMGHFVVVTSIKDGLVTYTDSDGKSKTASQEEFQKQWTGNILSTVEIAAGKALSVVTLQTLRGAFNIGAIIAAIIKWIMKAIMDLIMGLLKKIFTQVFKDMLKKVLVKAITQAFTKLITKAIMQYAFTRKVDAKALWKGFVKDFAFSFVLNFVCELPKLLKGFKIAFSLEGFKIGELDIGIALGKVFNLIGDFGTNPWLKGLQLGLQIAYKNAIKESKKEGGKEVPEWLENTVEFVDLAVSIGAYYDSYMAAPSSKTNTIADARAPPVDPALAAQKVALEAPPEVTPVVEVAPLVTQADSSNLKTEPETLAKESKAAAQPVGSSGWKDLGKIILQIIKQVVDSIVSFLQKTSNFLQKIDANKNIELSFKLYDIQSGIEKLREKKSYEKTASAEDNFMAAASMLFGSLSGSFKSSLEITQNISQLLKAVVNMVLSGKQFKYETKLKDLKDKYDLTDEEYDEIMKTMDKGDIVDWKKYGMEDNNKKFSDSLRELNKENYNATRGWSIAQSVLNISVSITAVIKNIKPPPQGITLAGANMLQNNNITYSAFTVVGDIFNIMELRKSYDNKGIINLGNTFKETASTIKLYSDFTATVVDLVGAVKTQGLKWDYNIHTFDKKTDKVLVLATTFKVDGKPFEIVYKEGITIEKANEEANKAAKAAKAADINKLPKTITEDPRKLQPADSKGQGVSSAQGQAGTSGVPSGSDHFDPATVVWIKKLFEKIGEVKSIKIGNYSISYDKGSDLLSTTVYDKSNNPLYTINSFNPSDKSSGFSDSITLHVDKEYKKGQSTIKLSNGLELKVSELEKQFNNKVKIAYSPNDKVTMVYDTKNGSMSTTMEISEDKTVEFGSKTYLTKEKVLAETYLTKEWVLAKFRELEKQKSKTDKSITDKAIIDTLCSSTNLGDKNELGITNITIISEISDVVSSEVKREVKKFIIQETDSGKDEAKKVALTEEEKLLQYSKDISVISAERVDSNNLTITTSKGTAPKETYKANISAFNIPGISGSVTLLDDENKIIANVDKVAQGFYNVSYKSTVGNDVQPKIVSIIVSTNEMTGNKLQFTDGQLVPVGMDNKPNGTTKIAIDGLEVALTWDDKEKKVTTSFGGVEKDKKYNLPLILFPAARCKLTGLEAVEFTGIENGGLQFSPKNGEIKLLNGDKITFKDFNLILNSGKIATSAASEEKTATPATSEKMATPAISGETMISGEMILKQRKYTKVTNFNQLKISDSVADNSGSYKTNESGQKTNSDGSKTIISGNLTTEVIFNKKSGQEDASVTIHKNGIKTSYNESESLTTTSKYSVASYKNDILESGTAYEQLDIKLEDSTLLVYKEETKAGVHGNPPTITASIGDTEINSKNIKELQEKYNKLYTLADGNKTKLGLLLMYNGGVTILTGKNITFDTNYKNTGRQALIETGVAKGINLVHYADGVTIIGSEGDENAVAGHKGMFNEFNGMQLQVGDEYSLNKIAANKWDEAIVSEKGAIIVPLKYGKTLSIVKTPVTETTDYDYSKLKGELEDGVEIKSISKVDIIIKNAEGNPVAGGQQTLYVANGASGQIGQIILVNGGAVLQTESKIFVKIGVGGIWKSVGTTEKIDGTFDELPGTNKNNAKTKQTTTITTKDATDIGILLSAGVKQGVNYFDSNGELVCSLTSDVHGNYIAVGSRDSKGNFVTVLFDTKKDKGALPAKDKDKVKKGALPAKALPAKDKGALPAKALPAKDKGALPAEALPAKDKGALPAEAPLTEAEAIAIIKNIYLTDFSQSDVVKFSDDPAGAEVLKDLEQVIKKSNSVANTFFKDNPKASSVQIKKDKSNYVVSIAKDGQESINVFDKDGKAMYIYSNNKGEGGISVYRISVYRYNDKIIDQKGRCKPAEIGETIIIGNNVKVNIAVLKQNFGREVYIIDVFGMMLNGQEKIMVIQQLENANPKKAETPSEPQKKAETKVDAADDIKKQTRVCDPLVEDKDVTITDNIKEQITVFNSLVKVENITISNDAYTVFKIAGGDELAISQGAINRSVNITILDGDGGRIGNISKNKLGGYDVMYGGVGYTGKAVFGLLPPVSAYEKSTDAKSATITKLADIKYILQTDNTVSANITARKGYGEFEFTVWEDGANITAHKKGYSELGSTANELDTSGFANITLIIGKDTADKDVISVKDITGSWIQPISKSDVGSLVKVYDSKNKKGVMNFQSLDGVLTPITATDRKSQTITTNFSAIGTSATEREVTASVVITKDKKGNYFVSKTDAKLKNSTKVNITTFNGKLYALANGEENTTTTSALNVKGESTVISTTLVGTKDGINIGASKRTGDDIEVVFRNFNDKLYALADGQKIDGDSWTAKNTEIDGKKRLALVRALTSDECKNITTLDKKLSVNNDTAIEIEVAMLSEGVFVVLGDVKCQYANSEKSKDAATLEKGAIISRDNDNKLIVIKGELAVEGGNNIIIAKSKEGGGDIKEAKTNKIKGKSKGVGGDVQKVNTKAVVIEIGDSYVVSNGKVSIRNGQFVVIGDGTILKKGSNLVGIGPVSGGDLKLVLNNNGELVYRSADNRIVSTTQFDKKTGLGLVTHYDEKGISGLSIIDENVNKGALQKVVDSNKIDGTEKTLFITGDISKGNGRAYILSDRCISRADNGKYASTNGEVKTKCVVENGIINGKNFKMYGLIDGKWRQGYITKDANNSNQQIFVVVDNGELVSVRKLLVDNEGKYRIGKKVIGAGIVVQEDIDKKGTNIVATWNGKNAPGLYLETFVGSNGKRSKTAEIVMNDGSKVHIAIMFGELKLLTGAKGLNLEKNGEFKDGGRLVKIKEFKFDNETGAITVYGVMTLSKEQKWVSTSDNISQHYGAKVGKESKESYKCTGTARIDQSKHTENIVITTTDGEVKLGIAFGLQKYFADGGLNKNNTQVTHFCKGSKIIAGTEVNLSDGKTSTVQKEKDYKINVKNNNIEIEQGTIIEIHRDGGIINNLDHITKGSVKIEQKVDIHDAKKNKNIYGGNRTVTYMPNADPQVDVKGDISQVSIGDGRFHIDLESTEFEVGRGFIRSVWDCVLSVPELLGGTLSGIVGIGLDSPKIIQTSYKLFVSAVNRLYGERDLSDDTKFTVGRVAVTVIIAVLTFVPIGRIVTFAGTLLKSLAKPLITLIARVTPVTVKFIGRMMNRIFNPFSMRFTDNIVHKIVMKIFPNAITASSGVVGNVIVQFSVKSTEALLKIALPMLRNAIIWGNPYVSLPLVGKNGVIGSVLIDSQLVKKLGIDIDRELYQAIANLAFFAPILASGMKSPASESIAESQISLLGAIKQSAIKLSQRIGNFIHHPARSMKDITRKSLFEGICNAIKKVSSWDTIKAGKKKLVEKGLKGVKKTVGSKIKENMINFVPRTIGMVSDIAMFQTSIGLVGGCINTSLGGKERRFLIFYIPKFSSVKDAIIKTSDIAVDTITDYRMWLFAVAIGVLGPLFTPIFRNFSVLGPIMRWIGGKNVFVGGKFATGRLGRYQRFIYEEAFQERLPEILMGKLGITGTWSEVVQEMFDRRGGGGSSKNYNTAVSDLGGDYINSVENINSLNNKDELSNIVGVMSKQLNERLSQNGNGVSVSVDIVSVGGGVKGGIEVKVKIVNDTIPDISFGVQEIYLNTVEELQNLMLSIGEAAVSGVSLSSDEVASRIAENNLILNNSENNSELGINCLSAEEKISLLSGMSGFSNIFGGDLNVIDKSGRISISAIDNAIKERNQSLTNNELLLKYVIGIVPIIENIKDSLTKIHLTKTVDTTINIKDSITKTQLTETVDTTINIFVEKVKNNSPPASVAPSVAQNLINLSALSNLSATILNSELGTEIKTKIVSSALPSISGAIPNTTFLTNLADPTIQIQNAQFITSLIMILKYLRQNNNTGALHSLFVSVMKNQSLLKLAEHTPLSHDGYTALDYLSSISENIDVGKLLQEAEVEAQKVEADLVAASDDAVKIAGGLTPDQDIMGSAGREKIIKTNSGIKEITDEKGKKEKLEEKDRDKKKDEKEEEKKRDLDQKNNLVAASKDLSAKSPIQIAATVKRLAIITKILALQNRARKKIQYTTISNISKLLLELNISDTPLSAEEISSELVYQYIASLATLQSISSESEDKKIQKIAESIEKKIKDVTESLKIERNDDAKEFFSAASKLADSGKKDEGNISRDENGISDVVEEGVKERNKATENKAHTTLKEKLARAVVEFISLLPDSTKKQDRLKKYAMLFYKEDIDVVQKEMELLESEIMDEIAAWNEVDSALIKNDSNQLKEIKKKITNKKVNLADIYNEEVGNEGVGRKILTKILTAKDEALKNRVTSEGLTDDIKLEAIALYSLTASIFKRWLNKEKTALAGLHREQIMATLVLLKGYKITELATGEGKAIIGLVAAAVESLNGNGAFLIKPKTSEAEDNYKEYGNPFAELLGKTIGVVTDNMDDSEKKEAYKKDITYISVSNWAFDTGHDMLDIKSDNEKLIERDLSKVSVIIDEVDSVLIDQAMTNFIRSKGNEEATEEVKSIRRAFAKIARDKQFSVTKVAREVVDKEDVAKEEQKMDSTYAVLNSARGTISATDIGNEKAIDLLGKFFTEEQLIDNKLVEKKGKKLELTEDGIRYLSDALQAEYVYIENVQYRIGKNIENDKGDNEILLISKETGVTQYGQRLNQLMQAIEAKHEVKDGIKIMGENRTTSSISAKNVLSEYGKVSGMTGTARYGEAPKIFKKLYNLSVVVIPSHNPLMRKDEPMNVFKTDEERIEKLVEIIKIALRNNQPILINTLDVDASEKLAEVLKEKLGVNVPLRVLNASVAEQEEEIIKKAGSSGITIATNMAGRGTDIKLSDEISEKGGLVEVIFGINDSERTDMQSRGRSGRQGQNGKTYMFVSLESDGNFLERGGVGNILFKITAGVAPQFILKYIFNKAQKNIEKMNAKSLYNQTSQSDKLYELQIMLKKDVEIIEKQVVQVKGVNPESSALRLELEKLFKKYCHTDKEVNIKKLQEAISKAFGVNLNITNHAGSTVDNLFKIIYGNLISHFIGEARRDNIDYEKEAFFHRLEDIGRDAKTPREYNKGMFKEYVELIKNITNAEAITEEILNKTVNNKMETIAKAREEEAKKKVIEQVDLAIAGIKVAEKIKAAKETEVDQVSVTTEVETEKDEALSLFDKVKVAIKTVKEVVGVVVESSGKRVVLLQRRNVQQAQSVKSEVKTINIDVAEGFTQAKQEESAQEAKAKLTLEIAKVLGNNDNVSLGVSIGSKNIGNYTLPNSVAEYFVANPEQLNGAINNKSINLIDVDGQFVLVGTTQNGKFVMIMVDLDKEVTGEYQRIINSISDPTYAGNIGAKITEKGVIEIGNVQYNPGKVEAGVIIINSNLGDAKVESGAYLEKVKIENGNIGKNSVLNYVDVKTVNVCADSKVVNIKREKLDDGTELNNSDIEPIEIEENNSLKSLEGKFVKGKYTEVPAEYDIQKAKIVYISSKNLIIKLIDKIKEVFNFGDYTKLQNIRRDIDIAIDAVFIEKDIYKTFGKDNIEESISAISVDGDDEEKKKQSSISIMDVKQLAKNIAEKQNPSKLPTMPQQMLSGAKTGLKISLLLVSVMVMALPVAGWITGVGLINIGGLVAAKLGLGGISAFIVGGSISSLTMLPAVTSMKKLVKKEKKDADVNKPSLVKRFTNSATGLGTKLVDKLSINRQLNNAIDALSKDLNFVSDMDQKRAIYLTLNRLVDAKNDEESEPAVIKYKAEAAIKLSIRLDEQLKKLVKAEQTISMIGQYERVLQSLGPEKEKIKSELENCKTQKDDVLAELEKIYVELNIVKAQQPEVEVAKEDLPSNASAVSPQIGKRAEVTNIKDNVVTVKDSQGQNQTIQLEDPVDISELKTQLLATTNMSDSSKALLLSMLSLLEKSPPEKLPKIYTYSTLVDDLLGFAAPEKNIIALHKSMIDNPIALFHEIAEYLINSSVINSGVINSGVMKLGLTDNKLILTMNNKSTNISLTENTLAIAKKDSTSPHYLLRALQRELFGNEDYNLTQKIKALQQKPIDASHPAIKTIIRIKGDKTEKEVFGDLLNKLQQEAQSKNIDITAAFIELYIDMYQQKIEIDVLFKHEEIKIELVKELSNIFKQHFAGYKIDIANVINPSMAIQALRYFDDVKLENIVGNHETSVKFANGELTIESILKETKEAYEKSGRDKEQKFIYQGKEIKSISLSAVVPNCTETAKIAETKSDIAKIGIAEIGEKVVDAISVGLNGFSEIITEFVKKIQDKIQQRKFDKKVGEYKREIKTGITNLVSGFTDPKFEKTRSEGMGQCVICPKKPEWEIVYYEESKDVNIEEIKKKWNTTKDNAVKHNLSVINVNGENVLIVVREKTESLNLDKFPDRIKEVQSINEKLWRQEKYDSELANDRWQDNYGVTADGRVALINPVVVAVVTEEQIRLNLTFDQIVVVNTKIEFKSNIWGVGEDGFRPDPFGLASLFDKFVKERKELGDMMKMTKLFRGAA
ncbi:MAG: cysteine peptidase family C39 domain-containing protein [Elusimicrobiota bacterium]